MISDANAEILHCKMKMDIVTMNNLILFILKKVKKAGNFEFTCP